MDNFRRHSTRRSKPTYVDGFVNPGQGSIGGVPSEKKSNLRRSRSYQTVSKKKVDDFSRSPDGFTPRQSSGNLTPDGSMTGRRRPTKDSFDMNLDDPKAKPPKKHRTGKLLFKAFASLCLISVLLCGVLFGRGYLRARQVFKGGGTAAALSDEVDPNSLHAEGDGRINVLLLARGGAGHDGPDLTDTIMVASVDPIQKEAGLLSLPRDLWVKTPNGSMKINAVFAMAKQAALYKGKTNQEAEQAGFEAIEKKFSEVTGIPIHYHLIVDFAGFGQAIDTVGGVTLDVKEPLYDPFLASANRGNPLLLKAGVQQADGRHALFYAQSRHGTARGDFDRNQHQREVLVALKDKIFSLGTFGNPVKVTQLVDNFGTHIQSNFNINDIMQLYNLGKQIDSSKITSVGLADPPQELVTTGNISGQSVVIPKAGTFEYGPIQSFVRNTLRDGFLKKENASVMVLNGTARSGAATAQAEVLKSYGYNVIGVSDAPTKDYTSTTLVDLRNGKNKYTKHYLELRLKTSATSKLPEGIVPGNADFVIIVGQNGTTQD
jgi:LCP family protein required for cell wall assembly